MFDQPFSFKGRIRRTEYGLALPVYLVSTLIILVGFAAVPVLDLLMMVPCVWFGLAQGVKRSHDLNKSGWFIAIPFYFLWLLFAPGTAGENQYGRNPRIPEPNRDGITQN